MIELHDLQTGASLGKITEEQLQSLTDNLEEENPGDQDYYLDEDTLEMLEVSGLEPNLLQRLKEALEGKQELEIKWSRSDSDG